MGYSVITLADGTKCYSGPNCIRHAGKQATSKTAMTSELIKKMDAVDVKVNPLAKETPVSIDTTLAGMYANYSEALGAETAAETGLKNTQTRLDRGIIIAKGQGRTEDHLNHLRADLISYAEKKEQAAEAAKGILDEMKPYEAEFRRRGGWTRAYIVTNANGHVHKSMSCSTCYSTTQYSWLTEYSNAKEDKIVEDAGSSACTTCYPDAPVEALRRKTVIEDPKKKEARVSREEAARAKAKIAQEKGVTNPDGTPLVISGGGTWNETLKTARAAEIKATDLLVDLRCDANPDIYIKLNEERRGKTKEDYNLILKALATKYETSEEELDKIYQDKADKKFKKDWLKK